jgi:hypothetical protein
LLAVYRRTADPLTGLNVSDDPLVHMRERIDRCRRLATYINDARTTAELLEMAEQGEIDLARLLAERVDRTAGVDRRQG